MAKHTSRVLSIAEPVRVRGSTPEDLSLLHKGTSKTRGLSWGTSSWCGLGSSSSWGRGGGRSTRLALRVVIVKRDAAVTSIASGSTSPTDTLNVTRY